MNLPADVAISTCDVYRPFGAGSPTHSNVSCRLVADFARGRMASGGVPEWTHYLEIDSTADIRDGCTRAAGAYVLTFADGDEVRVPGGASSPRFVVVWVETIDQGSPREFKRAYLLRHAA